MAIDEKMGIVKLSLSRKGSCNSVRVATRAPQKTGYSLKRTFAKIVQPMAKQTKNIASEPSRLLRVARGSTQSRHVL